MTDDRKAPEAKAAGTILVVEDDERARELVCDILRAEGYRVMSAANGRVALDILAREKPDAVLLDIMLPGMDGFEVCRRIKQDRATASIPVILLTALSQRDYVIRGISAGADEFVSKPIDMDELLLRVRNAVRMHQLYVQLDRQYTRLKAAEEWREQLFRMLAHDLKVPLAGVLGNLELLIEECRGKGQSEELECLADAREAALRALQMADTVVDIGRLEEGNFPLKYSSCRLPEILREAIQTVRATADSRGIAIVVEGRCRDVPCDHNLIVRVLTNLLDNAIAYSPAGSRVVVRLQDEAGGARIEIQDEGPGIPPEFHEKIFEKFTQVEAYARGRRYSKGLGLNFCKLAVEAHGGRIGLRSRLGQGSTFWFTLPERGAAGGAGREKSHVGGN